MGKAGREPEISKGVAQTALGFETRAKMPSHPDACHGSPDPPSSSTSRIHLYLASTTTVRHFKRPPPQDTSHDHSHLQDTARQRFTMKSLLVMNLIAWLIIAMVIGVSGALYVLRPTVSNLPSNITALTTSSLCDFINPTAMLLVNHPDFYPALILLLSNILLSNNTVAAHELPKYLYLTSEIQRFHLDLHDRDHRRAGCYYQRADPQSLQQRPVLLANVHAQQHARRVTEPGYRISRIWKSALRCHQVPRDSHWRARHLPVPRHPDMGDRRGFSIDGPRPGRH
jgi:hypothetical protein